MKKLLSILIALLLISAAPETASVTEVPSEVSAESMADAPPPPICPGTVIVIEMHGSGNYDVYSCVLQEVSGEVTAEGVEVTCDYGACGKLILSPN